MQLEDEYTGRRMASCRGCHSVLQRGLITALPLLTFLHKLGDTDVLLGSLTVDYLSLHTERIPTFHSHCFCRDDIVFLSHFSSEHRPYVPSASHSPYSDDSRISDFCSSVSFFRYLAEKANHKAALPFFCCRFQPF